MFELFKKVCGTRQAILAFLVLLISSPLFAGEAFRAPPPLAEIVGAADAIVIGRIMSINDETFKLRFTEVISLRKPFNQRSLTVRRSPRLSTEPRWAPYKKGQNILIFLKGDDETGQGVWSFAGTPNDSEWPVNEKVIYFYDRFIDGLPINSIKLGSYRFFAQMLPRTTVISALKGYRSCFYWEAARSNELMLPRRICGDEELEAFRSESVIHQHLTEETLKLLSPPKQGKGPALDK